ncbi:hypothetical protein BDF22DRAFT_778249 [Syncephalis plumigaleata]|nr:hypothetical protein BDF22DRAFT_778249 [Syncephalis plumigaleata]
MNQDSLTKRSAYAYIYYHRNYPPLKAKHVPIMGLFLISSFFWWLGMMHSNGVFGYSGGWSICSLWEVWMQFCLGASLTLALLIFDFTRFDTFSYCNSHCLSVHAVPGFATYVAQNGTCAVTLVYKCICFATAAIAAIVVLYFTWELRNVRRAFNEFRQLRYGCLALIFCVIWNSAIILLQYHWSAWGVYSMLILNVLTCTFFFWLVFFRPFYGHLFRREACMQDFLNSLTRDTDESLEMAASLAAAAAIANNNSKNASYGRVRPLPSDLTGHTYRSPV